MFTAARRVSDVILVVVDADSIASPPDLMNVDSVLVAGELYEWFGLQRAKMQGLSIP